MKLIALFMLSLIIFLTTLFQDRIFAAQYEAMKTTGWSADQDSRAGTMLAYRNDVGDVLIGLQCVVASKDMHLLSADAPFNTSMSIFTEVGRVWTAGRAVEVHILSEGGWRQVSILGHADRLMLGPVETEHAIAALRQFGSLRIRVMGNASNGVVTQDIIVSGDDFPAYQLKQVKDCTEQFATKKAPRRAPVL